MNLDEHQQRAVHAPDGPLLIVAPPGSGKTHTLVERVVRIAERGTPAEKILVLTFTKKAAKEVTERIARRVASRPAVPHVSTFHALAHEILRESIGEGGLAPNFTLVETETEKLTTPNSLTFDELIPKVLELFRREPTALAHWQARFSHILVDEYQDTDDAQEALLACLAKLHTNLCVIGDPRQSIYGFRGANVFNFLEFEERYPGAQTIELAINYRSTPEIIATASSLIAKNERGFGKGAPPAAARPSTSAKISVSAFPSPRAEATTIAREIESLIGGTYHPDASETRHAGTLMPGDIAVLYRFNAIGAAIEQALAERGIPSVRATEKNVDEIQFETFRVSLLSMHAAKGLEFPVVFIAGLEDGVMPSLHIFKNDAPKDENELLAEERRLLFVALTRARDELFLSHAASRTLFGKTYDSPSRFLADIPSHLIERRTASRRAAPPQQSLF